MGIPNPLERGTVSNGISSRGTESKSSDGRNLVAWVPRKRSKTIHEMINEIINNTNKNNEAKSLKDISTIIERLDSKQTQSLLRDYMHQYRISLFQHIEGTFEDKTKSDKLKDLLNKKQSFQKLPAPKKGLSMGEYIWPRKDREMTKERLYKPSAWPGKYSHKDLTPKLQKYADWIILNYDVLITPKYEKLLRELELSIAWPNKDNRPESVNDLNKYGDFECFAKFKLDIDRMVLGWNETSKELFYGTKISREWKEKKKKNFLKRLDNARMLFGSTKGLETVAQGIEERIRYVEKGIYK